MGELLKKAASPEVLNQSWKKLKKDKAVWSQGASRAYFTEEEDQAMLLEFYDFDKNMIHEKYKTEVEKLESN